MSNLVHSELVELCLLMLKDAKRDYRSALAYIQRRERFLAKQIEGLGYDGERLYAPDSFRYPPRPVTYNGGLSRVVESSYTIFLSKDESGWHFWIAPTTEGTGPSEVGRSSEAKRLVDAPAGLVLYCAEGLERHVVTILEQVASLVTLSYRPGTHAVRRDKGAKKAQFDA
ncbi:hypothetical protein [Polyangium aurulentum]|uniref:hypothetical protein n=1 Tax=Polyangium aurulentum TaxID=2567896 RepID=UPI0010AE642B|nr:hypothetical protein [Polyangium aurulentum]UQA57481.1 hypothetical protein E8A73_040380 [Polyangium aurulentum]